MADLSERDIIAAVRPLARVTPSAEASQQAVAAARAALVQQQVNNRAVWRRRLFMSGSIAALVAVVVGVGVTFTSQRADAAALLAQVAEASGAYRGWVKVRTEMPPAAPGGEPRVSTMHLNTVDGTTVWDMELDGVRHVALATPGTGEQHNYDSASNEITITDVHEITEAAAVERMRNFPTTIAAALADLELRGSGRPQVSERMEDGLLRLDVTFPPASSPAPATTRPSSLPTRATLWADPQTKLLARSEYVIDGGVSTMTFTYGERGIASLHDVGVPRNVRVVNNRATKEVKAILDRLERRTAHGFGDGVVVLADLDSDGDPRMIQLSLRRGDAFYAGKYMIGRPRANGLIPQAPIPQNWPDSSADEVLRAVRDVRPVTFMFVTGTPEGRAAAGVAGAGNSTTQATTIPLASRPQARALRGWYDIAGQIWPTRFSMGLTGPTGKAELLTDPARPGLVAIRVVHDTPEVRRERTYWLDPSRDDLPVEFTDVTIIQGDKPEVSLWKQTRFSEPKQLPSGQWYPSRWTESVRFEGDAEPTETRQAMLRVYPDHPVEADWFTNPIERLRAAATRPSN